MEPKSNLNFSQHNPCFVGISLPWLLIFTVVYPFAKLFDHLTYYIFSVKQDKKRAGADEASSRWTHTSG